VTRSVSLVPSSSMCIAAQIQFWASHRVSTASPETMRALPPPVENHLTLVADGTLCELIDMSPLNLWLVLDAFLGEDRICSSDRDRLRVLCPSGKEAGSGQTGVLEVSLHWRLQQITIPASTVAQSLISNREPVACPAGWSQMKTRQRPHTLPRRLDRRPRSTTACLSRQNLSAFDQVQVQIHHDVNYLLGKFHAVLTVTACLPTPPPITVNMALRSGDGMPDVLPPCLWTIT
jgi:hypothetical protein